MALRCNASRSSRGRAQALLSAVLLLAVLPLAVGRVLAQPAPPVTPGPVPAATTVAAAREDTMPQSVYEFTARRLHGEEQSLDVYRGQVLLVVNTASRCGLTPQYAGLQQLHDQYSARGFTVLGFPCNQFANQEPGTETEIATFCQVNYGVTFPMFAPIDVNGDDTHPLYRFLKSEKRGLLFSEGIKWNFTKFLVDTTGQPVKRYAPQTKPEDLRADIEALLPPQ